MSEFKQQGGGLTGREERRDGFAGEPNFTTDPSTIGAGTLNSEALRVLCLSYLSRLQTYLESNAFQL
jgi:hypothetical protein